MPISCPYRLITNGTKTINATSDICPKAMTELEHLGYLMTPIKVDAYVLYTPRN